MYEEYQKITVKNRFGEDVIYERCIVRHDEEYIQDKMNTCKYPNHWPHGRFSRKEAIEREKVRDRQYMTESTIKSIMESYKEFLKSIEEL